MPLVFSNGAANRPFFPDRTHTQKERRYSCPSLLAFLLPAPLDSKKPAQPGKNESAARVIITLLVVHIGPSYNLQPTEMPCILVMRLVVHTHQKVCAARTKGSLHAHTRTAT